MFRDPVFAYCAGSYVVPTKKASGVEPLSSPPATVRDFDYRLLEGRKLLYFDLHGKLGKTYWFGDGVIALDVGIIEKADLGGALVFATSCYLAEKNSPMLDALLTANASYVVGGDGENWAPGKDASKLYGAHTLGLWFRRFAVNAGLKAPKSLGLAKKAVEMQMRRRSSAQGQKVSLEGLRKASKDTLEFRIYKLKKKQQEGGKKR